MQKGKRCSNGNKRQEVKKMKSCNECGSEMEKIKVKVEGAKTKAVAYECKGCNNIEFDKESGMKVVKEIEEKEKIPLTIHQKIVKLSHDRLGTYFNKNIVRSLDLKAGKDIYVSVPDKKKMIISLKEK